MWNRNKQIVWVALMGAMMMVSGCALGVDEALIDTNYGLSIALQNGLDRDNGAPGNGNIPGGGNADSGGGNQTTADSPGGENSGKHPNAGGGNGTEGDPDEDPGKGNFNRSDKSKGKNQGQD
ncbi:MAG: hypothetical protein IMF05_13205 [Proteobacteria bacterium]|nr:hypothetical protein [Pseudomonadota bacterium]